MSVVPPIAPVSGPSTEFQLQIPQGQPALPGLSIGDVLEARVLQRVDPRRVVLSLHGRELAARTEAPLSTGETLRLRVEGLNPSVVLGLVGKVEDEAAVAARYGKLFRSDPRALTRALAELAEALEPGAPGERATLPGGPAGRIPAILGSLLGTRESLRDGLFVRNFIHSLGLLMEGDLRRALKTGLPENRDAGAVSLKEALMRLAAEMLRGGETGASRARDARPGPRPRRSSQTGSENPAGLSQKPSALARTGHTQSARACRAFPAGRPPNYHGTGPWNAPHSEGV